MLPEDTIHLDDEIIPESSTDNVEIPETEEKPQQSEAEIKAIESGWNPDKEAYEKANPGKRWRPAEDYVERGEIFDTIHNLKRNNEQLKKQYDTLEDHYVKVREHTKAQVERELRQQLQNAHEIGDIDAASRITEEIIKAKIEDVQPKPKENEPEPLPPYAQSEVDSFINRNSSWFNDKQDNFKAVHEAKTYEAYLAQTQPNLPLSERFNLVERHIKTNYSEKFVNPNQKKPAAVEAGTPGVKAPSKELSEKNLNQSQLKLYKSLKNEEVKKQYILDLKALGEI